MTLLTPAASNAKTAKLAAELKVEAAILHLAPYTRSGHNTCPMASIGCAAACLNTAGRGRFDNTQNARVRKTQRFFDERDAFMSELVKEIAALERRAEKRGMRCAVRLNGTSDLVWETIKCTRDGAEYPNIMQAFPNVQFYDYTKLVARVSGRKLPANYHLTFSLSECNDAHALRALANGHNVAVVLDYGDALPETWNGYRVIDGDKHDYRFLDERGPCWVALKAKGEAKHDETGFVRRLTDTVDGARKPVFAIQANA